ncbi:hypothetical protein MWH25_11780 [Natroniella acetigena]|uniref:hypothetical protein n=1 Tax=Natroniella acetigena TaxID=52004 RepID=UPI00200A9E47|nr:hypothetical protein [Natroniella acetigena]MCK8828406.1 hypothetical protein [Natroniella acetigena]
MDGLLLLVSYISNGTIFPQPLDKEEEKIYLEKLKNGESDAKNVLIEHNMRLVAHIVKKFENTKLVL